MGASPIRYWSKDDIARGILKGDVLVLNEFKVLRLNSWLAHHPGGDLAILHFVGRDACCEIECYHSENTLKKRIGAFCVGEIEISERETFTSLIAPTLLGFKLSINSKGDASWVPDGPVALLAENRQLRAQLAGHAKSDLDPTILTLEDLYPLPSTSLSPEIQRAHVESYKKLHQRIKDAGLYTAPTVLSGYLSDVMRYSLLFGFAAWMWWLSLSASGRAQTGLEIVSALSLGLCWQQLTFLVHDAGHTSVVGADYWKNRYLAGTVASYIGGLSVGWWCDNHNVHHLVTNDVQHDPDIQHIPFFAITPKYFGSLWSTYYRRVMEYDRFAQTMIPMQTYLYYVILSLARFNLYANSYIFLAKKAKRNMFWKFEIAGIVFFWCWFGALLWTLHSKTAVFFYLLVSHIAASPVHVQIVLSHFSRSTEDLGVLESFPDRQLRTTMDVICDPSIEFIHGGLDKQITHHLFPRLPRHNLRAAGLLVKEFCKENGLEFAEYGFIEGNQQVLTVLQSVADQVKLFGLVAADEAKRNAPIS